MHITRNVPGHSESKSAVSGLTGGTNYSVASNVTLSSYRSAEVTSDLYKNGRTGNFSYSLPVGLAGNYLVDLHFADPVASGKLFSQPITYALLGSGALAELG